MREINQNMKNNFYEIFNLNNYKWWRNHRRIFTTALLLFLLSSYIREPQTKLFNAKDICGKWWMGQLKTEDAYKKLNLKSNGEILDYCVHFR